MLVPRGPGRGQLLAHGTWQGSEEDLRSLCWKPRAPGARGCGEGWLSFQIHWFMEEPAREGQGAACLVIVIVLITQAGSEQDPTLRQVPHHPLPSTLATIPSCPHYGQPSLGHVLLQRWLPTSIPIPVPHQGHTWGHPERATMTLERHTTTPCWEGRAGIPVMLRGVPRVPACCPSLRLCSAGAGRVVCVGSGPGALAQPGQVTQWKAASRSVPCPYLQLFQL